jgi:hypothetical protein
VPTVDPIINTVIDQDDCAMIRVTDENIIIYIAILIFLSEVLIKQLKAEKIASMARMIGKDSKIYRILF